jgi:hypothetical protein
MYKLLSGAKSVKQYRGDENLPEAKNGMKKCGCKHTKSKYKYANGTKNLKYDVGNKKIYIPFTEMQPSQQKEYRTGMQKDADFTVTNIGRYARPTKAQRELSARMDAKYKAAAAKKNATVKPVVATQKPTVRPTAPTQVQPKPVSKIVAPVQAKPTAPVVNPVVTSPKGESWSENQWKDFLKKKNNVPYVKPIPYIPVTKKQTFAKITAPKTKQATGVFLDPKSKGVLKSQQGPIPTPKPIASFKDAFYNFPAAKTNIKPVNKVNKGNLKPTVTTSDIGQSLKQVASSVYNTAKDVPSIIDNAKTSFQNTVGGVKQSIKNSLKESLPDGDIKETILNNPVSSWPSLASSAIRRKWAKINPENERTATVEIPNLDSSKIKSSEETKVIQRPDIYVTGDTLADRGLDRRYHIPEIIDLNSPNITYGTRSRGEYNEIETEGAPITSSFPFESSKKYFRNSKDGYNTDYMGVDSKGKIKIGKKEDFQDDDYQISRTNVQKIESFEGLAQAVGNSQFLSPVINMITDSGVKMKTNLNLLVPKGDLNKAENTYDEVSGGRYIFETPDRKERILVSGSLKTVKEAFNKMKKDNPYLRVVSLDNGSYAKGIRTFDQKLTADDLKTYDYQNPEGGGNIIYIKSRPKKYKYGTGALTIPEGSAIVTANGGKNKQALMAYKKGNYKLLNRIIDDMPEDRVNKKVDGVDDVDLGKNNFAIKASKKGKEKNRLDMTKREEAGEEIWQGENYAKKWIPLVDAALNDPVKYKKLLNDLKNYSGQDNATVKKILALAEKKSSAEVIMTIRKLATDGDIGPFHRIMFNSISPEVPKTPPPLPPPTPPNVPPGTPPPTIPPGPPVKKGFDVPSLAEVAARGSMLAQGVEGVPENYLKLGRYNYASQLPKTLREIQLAEQGGKESARDIVVGDAGKYLAQAGALSSARMKASNDAVIQDTLARQDILNKNVDLGNEEAVVNTGLKNQFAMQRSANRGAYNNQLVAFGQGIDTAVDASKLMESQKNVDNQKLAMLQSMAESGSFEVVQNKDGSTTFKPKKVDNIIPTSSTTTTAPAEPAKPKARGVKRLKTYKRK